MIRIWFFGTPTLAACVLDDLIRDDRFEVVFVVTNPDKPVGRHQELTPSPVKSLALEHHIPIFTPLKVRKNTEFLKALKKYNCDYFVVVAYGKILPLSVLNTPRVLSINVHGSLLPKYRGASPIQSALLSGDSITGVTIMQMSEGMDEGDIISTRTIEISSTETSGNLFEKYAQISGEALIDGIIWYESGLYTRTPQNPELATYCEKIEKEDGYIDWTKSAKSIYQMWQAYTPWPGISTTYLGKRLLLEKVWYDEWYESTATTGTVIPLGTDRVGVVCGKWVLTLEQVKLEWKKSQSLRDFLNWNQAFLKSQLTS